MRLIGNTVLLEPVGEEAQASPTGLLLVNRYKRPTLKFKVLGVGPGAFIKRGKKRIWRQPEVEAGEMVICRAQLDGDLVKHSLDDGSGRVIVHADACLLSWRE
jgi:co-chaperonin GroES (HSP10)